MDELRTWEERVLDEHQELQTKIDSLDSFFDTDKYNELDEAEQVRLRMQSKVMQMYAEILEERIDAFQNKEE